MGGQFRARPLPDAPQLSMPGESVAVLDDRGRVPVFEPDVAIVEVNKHRQGLSRRGLYRLVIRGARPQGVGLDVTISIDTVGFTVSVSPAITGSVDNLVIRTCARLTRHGWFFSTELHERRYSLLLQRWESCSPPTWRTWPIRRTTR